MLLGDRAPGQIKTVWITAAGELFNFRTTRITEPEHLGYFIERLASGIIHRARNDLVITKRMHANQHGVPAAHNERNVRSDFVVMIYATQKRGQQMAFEMVDREIRLAKTDGQSLGNRCAYHERTSQSRSACRRKRI